MDKRTFKNGGEWKGEGGAVTIRNMFCKGFRTAKIILTIGNCGSPRAIVAWAARAARIGVPPGSAGLHVTMEIRSAMRSEKKTAGLKKFISLNKIITGKMRLLGTWVRFSDTIAHEKMIKDEMEFWRGSRRNLCMRLDSFYTSDPFILGAIAEGVLLLVTR